MDVLNVVDKIYTATINFVRRFNSERSCLQIKSKHLQSQQVSKKHLQANLHFLIVRKSDKCRLRSTPQTLNSSAILKKTTTKKAGIYRYTTRERDIRKIRHSGPGCIVAYGFYECFSCQ